MKMNEKHRRVIRALVYDRKATITSTRHHTRAGDALHLIGSTLHPETLASIRSRWQAGNLARWWYTGGGPRGTRAGRWYSSVGTVLAFVPGGHLHGERIGWYPVVSGALGVYVGESQYRLDRDPVNRSRYLCTMAPLYGALPGHTL